MWGTIVILFSLVFFFGCAAYTPGDAVHHPEKLGPGGSAQALYEQGDRFYKAGELDKAIESYQEALRLRPNHAGTHNALGYAYIRTFRFRDAEAAFQEAIRLNPSFGCPHYGLAITYFTMSNKEAFLREFRAGERLHPDGAKIAEEWIRGLIRISKELQKKSEEQRQKQ